MGFPLQSPLPSVAEDGKLPPGMKPLSRRSFLQRSLLASAAASAWSAKSWAQVAGANGDIRVVVVGLNGRGRGHVEHLMPLSGVRVVGICDVDTAVLDRTEAWFTTQGWPVAKRYTDLRAVLNDPNVDAVTVATPNHWHSLAGIWACDAGKDVYMEKPVSHNVWEGRQLAAAAAKYNRVMQAGTQIRSGEGLQEAVAWVQAGELGRITAARGFCYKRRTSIGLTTGPQPVPESVNFDQWLGPAPDALLRRTRFHYDWHWQDAYGNGDVGNQGIHQMDVARWFLGESGLPRHTLSIGGRLGYVDDGETPNTQMVVHDFATAPLIFEVRGLPAAYDPAGGTMGAVGAEAARAAAASMDQYRGIRIGNIIDCEGGSVVSDNYFRATALDRAGNVIREFRGEDRHMQNFIDVVRSRRTAELYGPIEEGHISSALCHLGIISHRLGAAMGPERVREQVAGDWATREAYGRLAAHLDNNRVDLDRTPLTLGQPLTLEPGAERFRGENAAAANALLKRVGRAAYRVPQLA